MDITSKSLTELKALAFDQLVTIEVAQKNLQLINKKMEEINQTPVEATPEVVVEAPVETAPVEEAVAETVADVA